MKDGTEIPDELLIGVTRGLWPVQVFYKDETEAARWLRGGDQAGPAREARKVIRVKLTPIEELVYIPPSEPRLEPRPVELWKPKAGGLMEVDDELD